MSPPLPVGKLRAELLERLLGKYAAESARVVVGPRVGEDAAVIDMGDRYLVATTDPITFASDEIGWYALHVNANDLAVRGARPLWFLATVLLPEGGGAAPPTSAWRPSSPRWPRPATSWAWRWWAATPR
jgi:hydrogenase maturation factor